MIQNYNRYRVLQLYFDSPRKEFQLREMSRMLKLGLPSVRNHIKALEKEKFVKKVKVVAYSFYKADINSRFKLYKITNALIRIFESGLISYINDKCMPDTIILFGSASRGEDIEESDIDIFVQSPEKKLDLEKYEKVLNRKIVPFFEEKFSKLSKELRNNIINGIKLSGYLKIF